MKYWIVEFKSRKFCVTEILASAGMKNIYQRSVKKHKKYANGQICYFCCQGKKGGSVDFLQISFFISSIFRDKQIHLF